MNYEFLLTIIHVCIFLINMKQDDSDEDDFLCEEEEEDDDDGEDDEQDEEEGKYMLITYYLHINTLSVILCIHRLLIASSSQL